MSTNTETKSNRRRSAIVAAGIVFSTMLAFGTFAVPAHAAWGERDNHHDDHRGGHDNWRAPYYAPPPVVYAEPYAGTPYYPPPVVYGPAVGVNLPGVSIGIF
jgi:hypothetical protein